MNAPRFDPVISIAAPSPQTAQPPLRLAGIGVAIAAQAQTMAEAAADLAMDRGAQKMFSRLYGFQTLPFERAAPVASLLDRAARDLLAKMAAGQGFTHVYHCHTLPTVQLLGTRFAGGILEADQGGPEQVSLGMAHCGTGVAAFQLLESTLGAQDRALVLIGERAFHRRIRLIDDTTIMGEAAVAIAVTRGAPDPAGPYHVVGTHVSHDGCAALSRGHPTEPPQVGRDYTQFVASHIADALHKFGLSADRIDHVMPHNVNMVSWHPIARAVGIDPKRVFLQNIGRIGHCFGADPFLNLTEARAQGLIHAGDLVLLTSVGMGLTAASMLIRVDDLPSNILDS